MGGAPRGQLRLVLMECVATAGAMTRERVGALGSRLAKSGLGQVEAAFGTVFSDRADAAFRRFAGELAWGSFIWFASKPANLIVLLEGGRFDPRASLDAVGRSPLGN